MDAETRPIQVILSGPWKATLKRSTHDGAHTWSLEIEGRWLADIRVPRLYTREEAESIVAKIVRAANMMLAPGDQSP